MTTIVCLLEERSAEEMLKGVLPRILPDNVTVRYMVFEGKQDLEKRLTSRLRGWKAPNSFFLVMRDQDCGDCHQIKANLQELVKASLKSDATMIRIACHELESFYLGDLEAVEQGLEIRNIAHLQSNKKYRDPDILSNACDEFERLTLNTYQHVAGSRSIAPYLKIDGSNRSHSFNVLIAGIRAMVIK